MTLRTVTMGVSGCGKSSVGKGLAARLGIIPYRDCDDLYPPERVAKIREGLPVTDYDRLTWLDRVIGVLASEGPVIVGCSTLRGVYRGRLRNGAGGPVRFNHLTGSRDAFAGRMAARPGPYMTPSLVVSQLAALEVQGLDGTLAIDIEQPLDAIVTAAAEGLTP